MSAPRFTLGPWTSQGWVPTWMYIPVKDARFNVVCTMCPDAAHGYTRDEVEANARLIAAAPDLYDFIATLENDDGKIPAWLWERRNALLAKASGEQS